MKKQFLTLMALLVFTLTGTTFAGNSMTFPMNMSGKMVKKMEIQVMQPDSIVKNNGCNSSKMDKMKMDNKGQMHNMQNMKKMSVENRQAMMEQMIMLRKHMMQMMENAKKANGNGKMSQKQKDEMYSMMTQMMPKDKAQRAKMVQMNAKMVQMMKSGDMPKRDQMMAGMNPEMKAKMIQNMPKTKAEKAKMMETCMLMHEMMQKMMSEDKTTVQQN